MHVLYMHVLNVCEQEFCMHVLCRVCVLHAGARMDIPAKKGSQTWKVKSPWGTVTHFCDSGSSPALFLVFWPLLCAPSPMGDPRDLRSQSASTLAGGRAPEGRPFSQDPPGEEGVHTSVPRG